MTTLAPLDEHDVSAFTLPREGERGRAFRRAKRHSRRVRFLRIAVPGSAVAAIAVSIIATQLNPLGMLTKLPVDFGGLVISGSKITMQQPRIAGFTRDGRAYEFVAKAAAQDITNPDKIELQGLSGTNETPDQTVYTLAAERGIYETKTDKLWLLKDVLLKSTAGLTVLLSEAVVDTNSGGIVSDKPVEVRFPQGTINASRMEVVGSGDVVRFEGDVTMTLKSAAQVMHLGRVP